MKFSDMPYKRPDIDETKAAYGKLIDAFERASTGGEAERAYLDYDAYAQRFRTQSALARIRHSLNTADEFYSAEQEYFDKSLPLLREEQQRFEKALVASAHRRHLEDKFGGVLFKNIELSLKTFTPEIIPDLQNENRLISEYDKLIASAQINYKGKNYTLAQLTPFHQDTDRAVRKDSAEARSAWFIENSGRLDSLFDELVRTRTSMAQKMGYMDFVELGYYRMQRNCYDATAAARFRDGVREFIVPLATRVKKEQARRIGVTSITTVDDSFEFPDGNAKPTGAPGAIFAHGQKMYHELSTETAGFIDFMLENELFDVLARPGKSAGGYCSYLPEYKSPFVFANFNGTSGDIDVLTHEAGHAYAAFVCRDLAPSALRNYSHETAEVHSMSMEFFTWPCMEGFFGAQTAKYRYSHLAGSLTFIPYGVIVDEFQHIVYEKPDMKPSERNALWRDLEGKYRPWLDLSDIPFYSEGRRWQAQGHIYKTPFYYIDYCLARVVSLAFWAEGQKDRASAWARYRRLIEYAGTKTFVDLIAASGLPDPFDAGALKTVAEAAATWLDENGLR